MSPLPFPFSPGSSASPGTGARRELQAPGPRSPQLGGRSSTSQELQLQNSHKPGWGKGPALIPPGKHSPFQQHFTSETPAGSSPAREGPGSLLFAMEEHWLCGFNTEKLFHHLICQTLPSEQQQPDKPKEPHPASEPAGHRDAAGGDGGAAGRSGPWGDLSGLVPPSLGLLPICSFPRNSLSLAGAPRAADAPAPRAKVAFAA